jgi:hypothetical protein
MMRVISTKQLRASDWRANQSEEAGSRRPRRTDRPRCQAKTRAGGACLVRVEPGKARCRFHGGLLAGRLCVTSVTASPRALWQPP